MAGLPHRTSQLRSVIACDDPLVKVGSRLPVNPGMNALPNSSAVHENQPAAATGADASHRQSGAIGEPTSSFDAELPPIPGGWAEWVCEVEGRTFRILLPRSPDDFLDDPEVNQRHLADGYMPYWSHLWPTSLEMAQLLLRKNWPAGLPALEIGSGIGMTGVVGLAAGLDLIFSDYDAKSLELAAFNARRNGFPSPKTLQLDWRQPPTDRRYPLILGCDVIYERTNHAPILALLDQLLEQGGEAWIADPGRHSADLFIGDARTAGWQIQCEVIPRQKHGDRPDGVTNIWILKRPA